MLSSEFKVAAGSITGRVHLGQNGLLRGQNNQDAFAFHAGESGIVMVVCDGCGSEPHSEFGARLGAELLLANTRALLDRGAFSGRAVSVAALFERVRCDTLAQMRVLGLAMAGSASFTDVVRTKLLFTSLIAVIGTEQAYAASIGDGYYVLNGDVQRLGPFPDNKPPYMAYGLIESDFSGRPDQIAFQVRNLGPSSGLQHLLISTDGLQGLLEAADRDIPGTSEKLGGVQQFWERDLYFRNADAIRRRLALANSERVLLRRMSGELVQQHGLLEDDTTLVVARREAAPKI